MREEGRKEGRRETYCMAKPHFIYSFMRPWAIGLFLFGNYE
jgi:hypothetical protein